MSAEPEVIDVNEQPEEQPKKKPAPVVSVDEKGLWAFTNHIELRAAASMMVQTKYAPQHLRNEGPEAVAAAMLFCKQYGLPQKCMNQLAFIKGKLSAYGSLVTALAERHPEYGQKREFYIDENCEEICVKNKNLKAPIWAAVVQVKKKGYQQWNEYVFSMDDASQAGLDKPTKRSGEINSDSPWIKYTKDMLMHKARKRALNAEYASAIEGVEYYEDIREVKDVTPKAIDNSLANSVNEIIDDEINS